MPTGTSRKNTKLDSGLMKKKGNDLDSLWAQVDRLHRDYFPENELMPILGNGKTHNPRVMFIFINPTIRNISSNKDWRGPRFPFIGTKQVWRVFYKAGLFDKELMDKINNQSDWSVEFTNQVLEFLKRKGFYFTNIVKWTGHNASLPESKKIKLFLPVLKREIGIVRPKCIVTFGLIPFVNLTKQSIRLSDYYQRAVKSRTLQGYSLKLDGFRTSVIPCYFPIGRGNPKRAIELLKLIKF